MTGRMVHPNVFLQLKGIHPKHATEGGVARWVRSKLALRTCTLASRAAYSSSPATMVASLALRRSFLSS